MPIPKVDFSEPQDCWSLPVVFPAEKGGVVDVLAGPRGEGRIVSHISEWSIKRNELIVRVFEVPDAVQWIDDDIFDAVCAVSQVGDALIYLRDATDGEKRRHRVPVFIQDPQWPLCCGRSMVLVGQIDDDALCGERPPGAKLWWHDAASFYVFTCPVCLECKASGQQF